MAKFEYKQRIADLLLASKLRSAGAVLVQGPKWCGKSTTASQIAESSLIDRKSTRLNSSHLL